MAVEVKDNTRRGTRGVVRSFKSIQKEAKETARDTSRMDKEFGNLKKTMFGNIGKFAVLAGGFAALGVAMRKSMQSALEFNTAMAEVSTLLPAGSDATGKLAENISRLSREFGAMPVDQA